MRSTARSWVRPSWWPPACTARPARSSSRSLPRDVDRKAHLPADTAHHPDQPVFPVASRPTGGSRWCSAARTPWKSHDGSSTRSSTMPSPSTRNPRSTWGPGSRHVATRQLHLTRPSRLTRPVQSRPGGLRTTLAMSHRFPARPVQPVRPAVVPSAAAPHRPAVRASRGPVALSPPRRPPGSSDSACASPPRRSTRCTHAPAAGSPGCGWPRPRSAGPPTVMRSSTSSPATTARSPTT